MLARLVLRHVGLLIYMKTLLSLCLVITVLGIGNALAIVEEARAVPDYSSTNALLGVAMLGVVAVRSYLQRNRD